MPQVDGGVIRNVRQHRAAARRRQQDYLAASVGVHDEMLMETGGIGHTRHFARARLKGDLAAEAGRLYPVRITGVDGDVLEAEIA